MKIHEYSHRCGAKIISSEMQDQIRDVLRNTPSKISKGAASTIRRKVIDSLQQGGWSKEVRLDASSNITITGMRDRIGLCVQFGNISRIYADLIKLQTLFIRDSIDAGIILLPGHTAAITLGQNIANGDRLERELKIFSTVISMPLWIVSFDADGVNGG